MKKYLEERVEALELEIKILKAKEKLNSVDYMYNPSINLMSEPDLETAFASPFDKTNIDKNPLDTVSFNSEIKIDPFYVSDVKVKLSSKLDSDFPPYPDFLDSWDKSIEDIIVEENEEAVTSWGFMSNLDKMDRDFLQWLKTNYGKYKNEINS